jgi:hypothetical protein
MRQGHQGVDAMSLTRNTSVTASSERIESVFLGRDAPLLDMMFNFYIPEATSMLMLRAILEKCGADRSGRPA